MDGVDVDGPLGLEGLIMEGELQRLLEHENAVLLPSAVEGGRMLGSSKQEAIDFDGLDPSASCMSV